MAAVIRFDDVSKRYGAEVALDRFTLEVPGGSVFALLGENGAGKTTAIRILLGLAEPDAGRSEVLGLASDTRGLEIRRRVGYVPERLTLYEWMTVAEIGWFTAGFYGERFLPEYRRLTEQFGLPANRKIKSLSKGMRAKVGLSLAMAHDPEVLVLDEPTSGLDALVRREFLESMVDRAATGKTVFLCSHQIAEVERVADIVAILRQGKLPGQDFRQAIWTMFGLGGEVIAWGIFFSLLLKRTIVAAILAGMAIFTSVYWIPIAMVMFDRTSALLVPVDVVIAVNAIIAVTVTVADIAIASRWFGDERILVDSPF